MSIVVDTLHYIINERGPDELYDIVEDPLETRNLAGDRRQDVEEFLRLLRLAGTPLASKMPCRSAVCQ